MILLTLVARLALAQPACFPAGLNAEFVDSGTIITPMIVGDITGLMLMSRVPAAYGYQDFVFDTVECRLSPNPLLDVRECGASVLSVNHQGSGGVAGNWSAGALYSNLWFPAAGGGASIVSARADGDPGADIGVTGPRSPITQNAPSQTWGGPSGTVASMSIRGEMSAGSAWSHAAYTCGGGSGAVCLECGDPGGGCYVPIIGHMHNDSAHGTFYVGDGNDRDAGGGLAEQFTANASVIRPYNGPVNLGSGTYTTRYATTAGDLVLLGASIEPYFGNGTLPPCIVGTTGFHPNDGMGEGSIIWNHDQRSLVVCNPYDVCDGGTGWRKIDLGRGS